MFFVRKSTFSAVKSMTIGN